MPAALVATLLSPGVVWATAQTSDEVCTSAVSDNLRRLTRTISLASLGCIRDHARGVLDGTLEGCLVGDPSALAEGVGKTPDDVYAEACSTPPDYGVTNPATTSYAATTSVSGILRDAFGSNFDDALATMVEDGATSDCQNAVARGLRSCQLDALRTYSQCQEDALGKGPEALEACVAEASQVSCDLSATLDQQCSGIALNHAFPGCGVISAHSTETCLTDVVNRHVCRQLDTSGGLAADCSGFDTAAPEATATAVSCEANPLAFVDADGNPLDLSDGGTLQVECPIAPNPTPTENLGPDYGMNKFVWNSFIAMNWPAIDDGETRGVPDLTKRFSTAVSDELTVWESYKEKREVFYLGSCTGNNNISCSVDSQCTSGGNGTCNLSVPPGTDGRSPASLVWNGPLQYGPQGETLANPPLCSDYQGDTTPDRILPAVTKTDYDSLDETVEVNSEALETVDELCGGYLTNASSQCAANPDASPCCTIQGQSVAPRVWKGAPDAGGRALLYEVKVNYDYFDYVVDPDHEFYLDTNIRPAAANAEFSLPWRSNVLSRPANSVQTSDVVGYQTETCLADMGFEGTSGDPCRIGAVHLKAAWLLLEDEDPADYHTTEATYYKTDPADPTKICETAGTFGLVGLHIIQRTHQIEPPVTPPAEPVFSPIGGSYIFATWEHVTNDQAGFRYSNYDTKAEAFYPATSDTLDLTRMTPIPSTVQDVNDQVHEALNCDENGPVWCNYELVGVQFKPVDEDDPTIANGEQQFPLANLVIESNVGLQAFQGIPPMITPIDNFASVVPANTTDAFVRSADNVVFTRQGKNMGGCLGCHGVAQLEGFTFSFVSKIGQQGADIETLTPGQF